MDLINSENDLAIIIFILLWVMEIKSIETVQKQKEKDLSAALTHRGYF